MKISFEIIMVILIFIGCNKSQNSLKGKVYDSDVDVNIEEFKRKFFLSCIEFGYEGNQYMDSVLIEDVSLMADFPLGFIGYRTADSLARDVRKEIVADSIMLMTHCDYTIGKKRVFQICLEHFKSARIDSIAIKLFSRD